VTSTVMLGKLASVMDIDVNIWKNVIAEKVPSKTVEKNLKAFDAGYNV